MGLDLRDNTVTIYQNYVERTLKHHREKFDLISDKLDEISNVTKEGFEVTGCKLNELFDGIKSVNVLLGTITKKQREADDEYKQAWARINRIIIAE